MVTVAGKYVSLFWLVLAIGLACGWFSSVSGAWVEAAQTQKFDAQSSTDGVEVGSWRLTKSGWQDSAGWPIEAPFVPDRRLEQIHPLIFSALVLVLVAISVIWASSEWELARFFRRDQEQDDR